MSNKLEAALGGKTPAPPASFTDHEGDVFSVKTSTHSGQKLLELHSHADNSDIWLGFYAADATKIIALIAEAAKEERSYPAPAEVYFQGNHLTEAEKAMGLDGK